MRDLGSSQSPQNAFLLNLGLETLHLRMPRHCENAQKVAEYLQSNPKVAWVNYCGLENNKYYTLAKKYMPNGSCGVISFGLKGGRDIAIRFMDNLKLASIVTHVADARTSVLHPASHTHRQLSDEQLIEAGVAPNAFRIPNSRVRSFTEINIILLTPTIPAIRVPMPIIQTKIWIPLNIPCVCK